MSGWYVYRNVWRAGYIPKDELSKLVLELQAEQQKPLEFSDKLTETGTESWWHPEFQDFLLSYPAAERFRLSIECAKVHIDLRTEGTALLAQISAPESATLERVRLRVAETVTIRELPKEPPVIFIGHGKDNQWRMLKDHLHDIHKYSIEAYEIGPRAGLSVKEVLGKMLGMSSFAILILTGEDEHTDGSLHARENVIHEIGLFQGKLGFEKAIILLEEGVAEFSNILGINQIRFSKGKIREAYGDVLGTLKERT